MIDNYDSFTFNLVQYLGELGAETRVVKNDEITAEDALRSGSDGLLLSPGPCTPNEAGICLDVVAKLQAAAKNGARAPTIPLLGVCLGHQTIGQAFGGRVVSAERLMHGKTSPIEHDGRGVFAGIPSPFEATRYHSLIVERSSLPSTLEVSAWTREGEIMGLRHRTLAIEGVQFHPESILTKEGKKLVANWLASLGPSRTMQGAA